MISSDLPGLVVPDQAYIAEGWPGRSPEADRRCGVSDPLRIIYLLVMEDEQFDYMTPFQGFGQGWQHLHWSMFHLVDLPASVLEPVWPLSQLIAQRMGGANHLAWMPLMISALDKLIMDEIGFAVVIFTGTDAAARRVTAWAKRQPRPVAHVSTRNIAGTISPDRFDFKSLRGYCASVYLPFADQLSPDRAEAAAQALSRWQERKRIPSHLEEIGHNCAVPNHMVLRRACRSLVGGQPYWMSQHEADYTAVILESAAAVMDVRRATGLRAWNRLYIPTPSLVLMEPALFRYAYARGNRRDSKLTSAALMMIRRMQQQTGLAQSMDRSALTVLATAGDEWQAVTVERQKELLTHTLGVGLLAAQSCSAVVRLRPEVNHVFPKLSEFARNVRAHNVNAVRKSAQLFQRVQESLARAVGPERIAFIEHSEGAIKLVTDAPLELLPIAGLPLSMRRQVSRINATPGNLMMGALVPKMPVTLQPEQLHHILVVSSFEGDDPLRDEMRLAIEQLHRMRPGRFSIDFVPVATVDAFVDAVNGSTAPILIFDGHGTQDGGAGVGGLCIGSAPVDIWSLRPRMHSPPIVILSACDTQGLDAPTHAQAGNSFLALGASTVLGTLLPVGGVEGARFVYRLLLHLADFVPAAIETLGRALSWAEIMSDVLRLTLAKDIIDHLIRRSVITEEAGPGLFHTALTALLERPSEWLEAMRSEIATATPAALVAFDVELPTAIARSEAIRYVQLGTPERITVGSQDLIRAIFPFAADSLTDQGLIQPEPGKRPRPEPEP